MKVGISKEQSLELRKWMERQRVPKNTIDTLLSSQFASNTIKAFRMKKQIQSPDGWVIHFGANWARPLETIQAEQKTAAELVPAANDSAVEKAATKSTVESKPVVAVSPDKPKPSMPQAAAEESNEDIRSISEEFFSRTFMGLAEKLKRLQIEDVDQPQMQKIAFEIDTDHLAMLKKLASKKTTTVGALIRHAIRELLETQEL